MAVDLDGTLLHYDGGFKLNEFGQPIRGIVEQLLELKRRGWVIVIWTCRKDTPELREHLKKHEVPFDYVNDHPWNGPDNPRKIHADVYLDDKAIRFQGVIDGLADNVDSIEVWWKPEWI